MTELITAGVNTSVGVAIDLYTSGGGQWGATDSADQQVSSKNSGLNNDVDIASSIIHSKVGVIDLNTAIKCDNDLVKLNATITTNTSELYVNHSHLSAVVGNNLRIVHDNVVCDFRVTLPAKDVCQNSGYTSSHVYVDKLVVDNVDHSYIPTGDFNITSEAMGFTSIFNNPIDPDAPTPMSPVGFGSTSIWETPVKIDIRKDLKYGYSNNEFLVNGSFDGKYVVDEDAVVDPVDPVDPIISTEVIKFVNIINVVSLPDRTPIEFTDLTLAIDLDSVAWVFNFNITSAASLALVKPSGLTVKYVEIDINGELFEVFIGRTSTTVSVEEATRKPVRITKCVGWSSVKALSYPYTPKRSHVELSSSTPSGIIAAELTGTGFTADWNSVDWVIPANVFSYVEKAPLAAISELAQSVGAIIVPDKVGDGFSIEPRYPISPWEWSSSTPDLTLNEVNFFTMDTEWIPAESPDSVYVYGESDTGVGVKCVKAGTAGVKTLPTIVDKHITDSIAGAERGRIELANNGYKEVIPVTTYVGAEGIVMPRTLVLVNAMVGDNWYGMVTGVSVSLKRNGNALVQSLQIERHYE